MKRIIALILTLAFFAQDIAWADPDSVIARPRSGRSNLATQSLFVNPSDDFYAASIYQEIKKTCEARGIPLQNLDLITVQAILAKHERAPWLKTTEPRAGEILVTFERGNMLRFYEKSGLSHFSNHVISELQMPPNSRFGIQYLKVEALPAPVVESKSKPAAGIEIFRDSLTLESDQTPNAQWNKLYNDGWFEKVAEEVVQQILKLPNLAKVSRERFTAHGIILAGMLDEAISNSFDSIAYRRVNTGSYIGKVELTAQLEEGNIVIEVVDNGDGDTANSKNEWKRANYNKLKLCGKSAYVSDTQSWFTDAGISRSYFTASRWVTRESWFLSSSFISAISICIFFISDLIAVCSDLITKISPLWLPTSSYNASILFFTADKSFLTKESHSPNVLNSLRKPSISTATSLAVIAVLSLSAFSFISFILNHMTGPVNIKIFSWKDIFMFASLAAARAADASARSDAALQSSLSDTLGAKRDLFQSDLLKGGFIAKPPEGVKYLDAGELTFGVIIGGNALTDLFGSYRRLLKHYVERIYSRIISYSHISSLKVVNINRYYNDFLLFFHKYWPNLFDSVRFTIPNFIESKALRTFELIQVGLLPFRGSDGLDNLFFNSASPETLDHGMAAQSDGLGRFIHRLYYTPYTSVSQEALPPAAPTRSEAGESEPRLTAPADQSSLLEKGFGAEGWVDSIKLSLAAAGIAALWYYPTVTLVGVIAAGIVSLVLARGKLFSVLRVSGIGENNGKINSDDQKEYNVWQKIFHNLLPSAFGGPKKYYERHDPGENVESQKVHDFTFPAVASLAAVTRKTNVTANPPTSVSQGTLPDAPGTNTPTTNDPNSIFAPSRKKSDNVSNSSVDNIRHYSTPAGSFVKIFSQGAVVAPEQAKQWPGAGSIIPESKKPTEGETTPGQFISDKRDVPPSGSHGFAKQAKDEARSGAEPGRPTASKRELAFSKVRNFVDYARKQDSMVRQLIVKAKQNDADAKEALRKFLNELSSRARDLLTLDIANKYLTRIAGLAARLVLNDADECEEAWRGIQGSLGWIELLIGREARFSNYNVMGGEMLYRANKRPLRDFTIDPSEKPLPDRLPLYYENLITDTGALYCAANGYASGDRVSNDFIYTEDSHWSAALVLRSRDRGISILMLFVPETDEESSLKEVLENVKNSYRLIPADFEAMIIRKRTEASASLAFDAERALSRWQIPVTGRLVANWQSRFAVSIETGILRPVLDKETFVGNFEFGDAEAGPETTNPAAPARSEAGEIVSGKMGQSPPEANPNLGDSPYFSNDVIEAMISAVDSQYKEDIAAKPIPSDARILLSENLFDEADKNNLNDLVLKDNKTVKVASFDNVIRETIKELALDKNIKKEDSERKIACVVTRSEFERLCKLRGIKSEQDRENLKATILVLDDLKGENYIYLQGVLGLTKAMMEKDVPRIRPWIELLFGDVTIDDATLTDSLALALRVIFKFKPITVIDAEDGLDRYKATMESKVMA